MAQKVFADVIPPAELSIKLAYDSSKISEDKIYAKILFCDSLATAEKYADQSESLISQLRVVREYDAKKDCYWYPTEEIGVGGGVCSANNFCKFILYYPIIDYKFAIFLPNLDRVLISDEISSYGEAVGEEFGGYNKNLTTDGSVKIEKISYYQPSYRGGGIPIPNDGDLPPSVSPLMPSWFSVALLQTLIAELFVALIFILITKIPKKILFAVLLGNIISLPIVWFVFPFLPFSRFITLPLSEIFAVVFEAWLIYFMNKKTISFKRSLILSFLMNLLSALFPPPLY